MKVKNILLLLIVLLCFVVPVSATEFLYSESHAINGSDDDLSYYPMLFHVYKTSGQSSGNTLYCPGIQQTTTYNDIRFFGESGNALDYKVEKIYSSYADVWVSIDSIPTTGTNITVKWGNATCLWSSSGAETFTLYNQYDGQDIMRKYVSLSPAGSGWEGNRIQEPSVIYDINPVILTNYTHVYKMWYVGGVNPNPEKVGYAESPDGYNWTKYGSNPLSFVGDNFSDSYAHNYVHKLGSTYYFYGTRWADPCFGTQGDIYISQNGINWTLLKSDFIPRGTGTWDSGQLGNYFVWLESDNDWKMLYEANGGGYTWVTGYATSSNGVDWVKYGTEPVLGGGGSMFGGPYVIKIDNIYYLWSHGNDSDTLPTDGYLFKSTNLTSWEKVKDFPILARATADEGSVSEYGQVADMSLVEVNNVTYLYYTAVENQMNMKIKVAVGNMSVRELINTDQAATHNTSQWTRGYTGGTSTTLDSTYSIIGESEKWNEIHTTASYTGAFRAYTMDHNLADAYQSGWGTLNTSNNDSFAYNYTNLSKSIMTYNNSTGSNIATTENLNTTFKYLEFDRYSPTMGVFKINDIAIKSPTDNISVGALPIYFAVYGANNYINIRALSIRKVAYPEPTHGAYTSIVPSIYWDVPSDVIEGTSLSADILDATAPVSGTFIYTPSLGTVLNLGTQTLHVDFTPTDTTNYTVASKNVTINVIRYTSGTRDSFVRSWENTVSMVGAIIIIALAGSMIMMFRGKKDLSEVVNDLPGIMLIVVLLVVGAIIFGQF